MNQKLLEQLQLAKEAGSNAMAKDFFSKPENPVEAPPDEAGMTEGQEPDGDEGMPAQGLPAGPMGGEGEPSEEELQELLRLLEQQGQG